MKAKSRDFHTMARDYARRRETRATLLLAVVVGVLAGCASAPSAPPPVPTDAPDGPVIDQDFPDPDILATDDGYFAFATNGNANNVQVATSTDLESWEVLADDALPKLPPWVIPGKTWAPEVSAALAGGYVMYFTATNYKPSLQCIGVATSTSPTGPFEVQGDGMLVCPPDEGGAIDASTFTDDDGSFYLLWKNDGNCCGLDTWISISALSPDGLSLTGEPQRLIKQDLAWEGDLVEAPTLVSHDDSYFLLYSANTYGDENYAIGLARASSLDGPWKKTPEPFFSTDNSDGLYLGPGGQDVVSTPSGDYLFFHDWDDGFTYRGVNVEPLAWEGGEPVVVLD